MSNRGEQRLADPQLGSSPSPSRRVLVGPRQHPAPQQATSPPSSAVLNDRCIPGYVSGSHTRRFNIQQREKVKRGRKNKPVGFPTPFHLFPALDVCKHAGGPKQR